MQFPNIEDSKGGKFIKMKSGERIVGLFLGDPFIFQQHWVDGKGAACTGASCEHCKNGDKASTRFQINFLTQEDGVWMAKIFEQGNKTMRTLKSFHEEYDLEKTLVTVTKQGERMTTVYNLLPAKTNLSAAELKRVSGIPLNKLGSRAIAAAKPVIVDAAVVVGADNY